MTTKHTPGPWTQVDCLVVVLPPEHDYSTWIANVSVGGERRDTQIANARLIAAAPDLLTSLEAMVSAHAIPSTACKERHVYEEACTAIAKARGEA
jgi:hypothetical protein